MNKIFSFFRRNKWKSLAGAVVLLLVALGVSSAMTPAEPEYLTETVKRADIRQTVEAVGTVISERELELRFSGVGIVSAVNVTEGQRVKAGQRLAQLKAGNLGAGVAAQQASLQSALAELRAMEEGTRPEDIAVAEADVSAKRASLQVAQSTLQSAEKNLQTAQDQIVTLQQEATVSLAGQVSTSMSALAEQVVTVETSLSTIDDILSRVDVQDAIIKDRPGADNEIRAQRRSAQEAVNRARLEGLKAADYQGALSALASARVSFTQAQTSIDALFFLISSLPETSNFTTVTRETYKASISTERSQIQDASATLSSTESSLRNASAAFDTKISSQEVTIASQEGTRDRAKTDILTYEAAIRTAEAQLALRRPAPALRTWTPPAPGYAPRRPTWPARRRITETRS
jgi:hypothetical protein